MKLVSVEQMRSIEAASDTAGHTYDMMLDRAGAGVADVIRRRSAIEGKRVLVLVGPGNNGGDGLVAAKHLREAGADVACYLLKARDDARVAAAREAGVFLSALPDDRGLRVLRLRSQNADVIIDALFGTGARLPLPAEAGKILNTVKGDLDARRDRTPTWVAPANPGLETRFLDAPLIVAVDGPSGMDFDSGELDPGALPADVSVTFAYPKVGHTRFPAADACGELIVVDIGIDPALAKDVSLEMADAALIRPLLPARPASAHKGTFGKVMIVAGSLHYTGAPTLAALAAYRSGAGLVTAAVPRSIAPIVAAKLAEATFQPLPDAQGVLSADAVTVLAQALEGYRALLLGPGLTREKEAAAFVERLFGAQSPAMRRMGFTLATKAQAESDQVVLPPLVVDADGLNILAGIAEWWKRLPASSVLTPHPGEMARLSGLSTEEIGADRIGVAAKFARQWGHVVVLKGAFSVVAAPDGKVVVMPFANPALASAGSGDVLAGTIVALRGQGLGAFDAALAGAYLHGVAGELARREIGGAGVVAGDVLDRLPGALRAIANG
ncbi:MAG TPA: NAD(P)H-hydrate dehydratase [Anaerolineae bacterium]|nr:NAD(P)H-hydrate dehydratase [Anaerolineae bacterium]